MSGSSSASGNSAPRRSSSPWRETEVSLEVTPTSAAATWDGSPLEVTPLGDAEGWMQLFNGKDLTGWKTHALSGGDWRVEDGAIDGRGSTSYLFTESGDYANFHLRVEAKINGNGDAGVYIRTPFDVQGLPNPGPSEVRAAGRV